MTVSDLIARARSLDSRTASVADYRAVFDQLANGHIFATITPSDGLWYRARANIGQTHFTEIQQLWCRPIEEADQVKLGRANEPGKPVLYLANDGATALREIPFSSGGWVTVLSCRAAPNTKLNLQEIGLRENVRKGNLPSIYEEIDRRIAAAHSQGYGDRINHPLVRSYFSEEFTRSVGHGEDHLYKPTAAIASLLMSYAECDGIAYPAVRSDKQDVNIALKPEAAGRKLEVVRVDVVQAFREPDGKIAVRLLKSSSGITSDGHISYRDAQGRTTDLPWIDGHHPWPN